ncbi:MoaD/ThiS family protein [Spirochaeta isovalerica]|uniref:Molybdopterin converting factor small subunit n=1 Tax=Spirochaeta isovalerica TaxID=150 RepID=A0A841R6W8_9SPIO|nr:MoaD/ThiS family protein [Spirochaeta isovalerica]MBB6480964.1 molybdopterin converting factor small subunit [Spirochaeta isovalerica]
MTVEVKTFATLRTVYPPVPEMEISEGESIGSLVDRLGIPREKITIIFINNIHGTFDSPVKGGDSIGLFPPIGGG